jgi:hypothetical protein
VQAGQERRVAKLRAKPRSPAQVERRQTARAPDLAEDPKPGSGWTPGQLALLGILPDDRVAAMTGRNANGVRVKRCKLGIPNPSGPGWTAEELDLLGTMPDAEVAARTGRTENGVTLKRCRLRISTFCDRRRVTP